MGGSLENAVRRILVSTVLLLVFFAVALQPGAAAPSDPSGAAHLTASDEINPTNMPSKDTTSGGDQVSTAPTLEPPPCLIDTWGTPEYSPGQMYGPFHIAVEGDGNVLVFDFGTYSVQRFGADGVFVDTIATFDDYVGDIDVGLGGEILILYNNHVRVYDSAGALLESGVVSEADQVSSTTPPP